METKDLNLKYEDLQITKWGSIYLFIKDQKIALKDHSEKAAFLINNEELLNLCKNDKIFIVQNENLAEIKKLNNELINWEVGEEESDYPDLRKEFKKELNKIYQIEDLNLSLEEEFKFLKEKLAEKILNLKNKIVKLTEELIKKYVNF